MSLVLRGDPERPIPPVVAEVLLREGWTLYDEDLPPEEQPPVNLYWKTNRFFPSEISAMNRYPYQRVNHYPRSSEITKKDLLYRHMRRMKGVHGSAYDFVPVTFALPTEYVKFCQYFADQRDQTQANKKRDPIYICKPSELSRGRKIFCFDDIGDLTYDCSSVVQEYVANPLLLHKHKADFRIYVLAASVKPLRAYIYTEGLARMSAEEYTLDDVKNVFAHLTNYSVNKTSEAWSTMKDGIGEGCKWDFKQTREYFQGVGVDWDILFDRIECLVCLTLLSISNSVTPVNQCFELYGFDVLFDCNFKPWLMEVNFSPSLAIESDVDGRVKEPLIKDLVETAGIIPFPSSEGGTEPTSGQPPRHSGFGGVQEERKTNISSRSGRPPIVSTCLARKPSLSRGTGGVLVSSSSSTRSSSTSRDSLFTRNTGVAGGKGLSKLRASSSTSSSRPSGVTRGGSMAGGGVGSSKPSRPATTTMTTGAKSADPVFVDKAAGKFKTLFPFSETSEDLNKQMANSGAPEKLVRQIVTEIRKRDQKNVQIINSWLKKAHASSEEGGVDTKVQ